MTSLKPYLDRCYQLFYILAYQVFRITSSRLKLKMTGAQVMLIWEKKVLLVRSSYRSTYSFPGGYINRGEAAIEAACRELREETGIVLQQSELHPLSVKQYDTNKSSNNFIFTAVLAHEPFIKIDNREVVEAQFFDASQVQGLPLECLIAELHKSAVIKL